MSPGINNHGGGVDSGGSEPTPGPWVADRTCVRNADGEHRFSCGLTRTAYATQDEMLANARLIASAPDLHRLLTKSLCTLQALVSNMEESGWQPIETAPKSGIALVFGRWGEDEGSRAWWNLACCSRSGVYGDWNADLEPTHWMPLLEPGQAVLGTFDLEALKTLVGEIEEVRGRAA